MLIGLQVILIFIYCLVYLKFFLLGCIGLQVKDNDSTVCSVDKDNMRIGDMLA